MCMRVQAGCLACQGRMAGWQLWTALLRWCRCHLLMQVCPACPA